MSRVKARTVNREEHTLDLFLSLERLCPWPLLSHAASAPFVKACCLWPETYRKPILKALTFKGITLFQSHRDKKLQNAE